MPVRRNRRSRQVSAPRFRVQQNRGDGRLHIAARAGAESRELPRHERIRHALHIGGAGIAAHQMLDQLLANERRQTRLRENVVERAVQIRHRRLPRRKHRGRAARGQKRLRGRIVIAFHRHHWARVVWRVMCLGRRRWNRRIGPAGKHPRHRLHRILIVRGDWISAAVILYRTVLIELVHAQGEELHQFARVVLIRVRTECRVRLIVVHHVQIAPHGRAQRDVAHDRAVVRERILQKQPHIWRHALHRDRISGCHPDLAQRQSHALAQLIGIRQSVREKRPLRRHQIIVRDVRGRRDRRKWTRSN